MKTQNNEALARHFTYLFESKATLEDFQLHRKGKKEIRLYVNGACGFGWIKAPTAFDAAAMAQKIKELQLPLIVIDNRALWWFGTKHPIGIVIDNLKTFAKQLKLEGAEIFPKPPDSPQVDIRDFSQLKADAPQTTGAPYFGKKRVEILADGKSANVSKFVEHAMALRKEEARWQADMDGTQVDDSGPEVSDDSAAQILIPHWVSTQRDEIGMAVAGILLRRGFPDERVNKLIKYVAVSAHDEDWDDRIDLRYGIVAKTRKAIAKKRHVMGIPTLKEYIGQIQCDRFLEAMGITQNDIEEFKLEEETEAQGIELLAFTLEELDAPLREERYLIEGLIPTDAYSLIAGALGSYKTFYLIYLMIRRATGYDLLSTLRDFPDADGYEEPIYDDAGPCVLLTYEDTDWRIADRIKRIAQYGYEMLKKRHDVACADRFKANIMKNLRRVPLSGKFEKTIIVRGEGGIIPNYQFIDEVFEMVRAFTADSVLLGLDPLRLAILGSQSDDEIAQVGVTVLNLFAQEINKDSGVVALSHATKEGSKNKPNGGYIESSTYTSGSVVWSQHARSNFSTARLLPDNKTKKLFGDQVSAIDIEKQHVMELTHGRLSHGAEDETRYLLMDGGLLLPLEVAKGRSPNDEIDAALIVVARVIEQLRAVNVRASQTALRNDDQVKAALGADATIRAMLEKLVDKGFIEFPGPKTRPDGVVTDMGRRRLTDLERAAKHHEPSRTHKGAS